MKQSSSVSYLAILCILLCACAINDARPQWNDGGNPWISNNQRRPQRPQRPPQFPDPINNNNNDNGNNNNNNNGFDGVVTSTAATPTTASPQYLACLQSCPSTSEYNPVCGSDSINYHNSGRLQCAIRCGKDVLATRIGTCAPL